MTTIRASINYKTGLRLQESGLTRVSLKKRQDNDYYSVFLIEITEKGEVMASFNAL